MTRLAALALLLLAGCTEEYESSTEDAAADAAYDAVADSGIEDRIAELEGRIDDLEASGEDHGQRLDALYDHEDEQAAVANDNDAMLDRRIRNLEGRLGM